MPKLFRLVTVSLIVLSLLTSLQAFQFKALFTPSQQSSIQPTMSSEQTFIAIKPDGVLRGLVGEIIGRFEKRGYPSNHLTFTEIDSNWLP
jgi:hypothetical protein